MLWCNPERLVFTWVYHQFRAVSMVFTRFSKADLFFLWDEPPISSDHLQINPLNSSLHHGSDNLL